MEACDQPEPLNSLYLPAGAPLSARWDGALLGGVTLIEGAAEAAPEANWTSGLSPTLQKPKRVPHHGHPLLCTG